MSNYNDLGLADVFTALVGAIFGVIWFVFWIVFSFVLWLLPIIIVGFAIAFGLSLFL